MTALHSIGPTTEVGCWACGTGSIPLAEAIKHFESREHRDSLVRLNLMAGSRDRPGVAGTLPPPDAGTVSSSDEVGAWLL